MLLLLLQEAEEVSKALAKGPGGVDGARAPGESGVAWEKRLQQSMRKVVDRLAERERRVVQLKVGGLPIAFCPHGHCEKRQGCPSMARSSRAPLMMMSVCLRCRWS